MLTDVYLYQLLHNTAAAATLQQQQRGLVVAESDRLGHVTVFTAATPQLS